MPCVSYHSANQHVPHHSIPHHRCLCNDFLMRKFCLHVAAWMITRSIMEIPMIFQHGPSMAAGAPAKHVSGKALVREKLDGSVFGGGGSRAKDASKGSEEAVLRGVVKDVSGGGLAGSVALSSRSHRQGHGGHSTKSRGQVLFSTGSPSKKAGQKKRVRKHSSPNTSTALLVASPKSKLHKASSKASKEKEKASSSDLSMEEGDENPDEEMRPASTPRGGAAQVLMWHGGGLQIQCVVLPSINVVLKYDLLC